MVEVNVWEERAVPTPQGTVKVYELFLGDLNSFYVASLEEGGHGTAWGMGSSPREALADAARKWQEHWKGERENPFLQKGVRFEPHSAPLSRLTGREQDSLDRDLYGD